MELEAKPAVRQADKNRHARRWIFTALAFVCVAIQFYMLFTISRHDSFVAAQIKAGVDPADIDFRKYDDYPFIVSLLACGAAFFGFFGYYRKPSRSAVGK